MTAKAPTEVAVVVRAEATDEAPGAARSACGRLAAGSPTANSRVVRVAEAAVVAGATALAVAVSTDAAVAAHPAVRSAIGAGMVATWIVLLALERSADHRVLGRGIEEYRRVLLATGRLLAAVAIVLLVGGIPLPRQTLLIAIGGGLAGCLAVHLVNAGYLGVQRRHGGPRTRLLLVGTHDQIDWIAGAASADRAAGYEVVGLADLSIGGANPPGALGTPAEVVAAARRHRAEAVVVAAGRRLDPDWLRDLRWALRRNDVDLMIVPDVAAIAQPKLRLERLGGLSLLRVDEPGYSSASGLGKSVFDAVTAVLILILCAPVLALVALAIKAHDGGPVFYRPQRVGRHGAPFRMWKFRSMDVDAETQLAAVREAHGLSDAAFFKLADDPRITRVGRLIRRTSIDELPQLLNVVRGEMSLIGPRPMIDGEGARFPEFLERRMMVKPGMTGLWQVSGRSDTTEDERVDLDLYYVENWSLDQDLRILFKTAVTVARGSGAC